MELLGFQTHRKRPSNFISLFSAITSCIFVLLSHFSLALIPHYLSSLPLLAQLSLSALLLLIVTGLGNGCRRLLGFYASAPAFVFFNILFIWGIHITVIQKEVPLLWSIVFNAECILLIFGLYSIISSDPGLIAHGDASSNEIYRSETLGTKSSIEEKKIFRLEACLEQPIIETEKGSLSMRRIRYCKYCKAYIRGFDHHCPAFGNCIGQKNHLLFMALLVGFVMVEVSYIVFSSQFITKSRNTSEATVEFDLSPSVILAISTMLFSILQVLWQVLFITWHIYCISANIKTDEWIHWRKYPEFQNPARLQPAHSNQEPIFRNPYDKGVFGNIKECLSPKE